MKNELTQQLEPAVKKAAHQAFWRWNKLLSADDIEQELWIFILESPSVQEYLLKNEEGDRVAALKIKADSICSKERLDYDRFTGNFTYMPADVRRLLKQLTQETRLLDEERIDLEEGLKHLESEHSTYHDALIRAYWYGYPVEDKSEEHRRSRAVAKLADIMNRKNSQREAERTEGLGTRPSNTTNREER